MHDLVAKKYEELKAIENEHDRHRLELENLAHRYIHIESNWQRKKEELDYIEQQLESKESQISELDECSRRQTLMILRDAYLLMQANHRKFLTKALAFTEKSATNLDDSLPKDLKPLLDTALIEAGFDTKRVRSVDLMK